MLDFIMSLFGYENVWNIKIPKEYKMPRSKKLCCKMKFYNFTGKFVDKIIINNANVLLDGYTTLQLCRHMEIKYVKVIRINSSVEKYLKEFKAYRVQRNFNYDNSRKRRF